MESRNIAQALENAAKLKEAGAANEANTKALLIEPMLAALGWDTSDPDAVVREVKVFDNTFLDYALRLEGTARLYVEAKGLLENLDDKKFIAQTVNYANNDGVLWCVLTNGLRYCVYKTNEPVAMDRKLLFEVDLAADSEPDADKAKQLRYIGRQAVGDGDLDRFGERVFTDTRVRGALAALAEDPPAALLALLDKQLGIPKIDHDALQRSLARVLDAHVPAATAPSPPVAPPAVPKGHEYTLDHHLDGKSSAINDLFERVDEYGRSLGADVTRRIRKHYIGYYRAKKSFFTVELQKQRVILYLGLDPKAAEPWNAKAMRDLVGKGHWGMGDTEYSLRDADQLDEARALITSAYDAGG